MNQTLKQIKDLCKAYDIHPTRSKGQNFLIDPLVIDKIIKIADLSEEDTVLEVGPGLGILTEQLVRRARQIISVELDKKLFSFLKMQFAGQKNLTLVNQDILDFDPASFQLSALSFQVVANLPYNITSVFLKKFLTSEIKPSQMTLLLQKEVAQRICARPGQMSLLAISVQLYGRPEIIDYVKSGNFWPEPAVDSAILHISDIMSAGQVKNKLQGITDKDFWRIVKIGFSAKRKQLQNNLAAGLRLSGNEIKNLLKQANLDPAIRAQNLSLDDWIGLAKKVAEFLK